MCLPLEASATSSTAVALWGSGLCPSMLKLATTAPAYFYVPGLHNSTVLLLLLQSFNIQRRCVHFQGVSTLCTVPPPSSPTTFHKSGCRCAHVAICLLAQLLDNSSIFAHHYSLCDSIATSAPPRINCSVLLQYVLSLAVCLLKYTLFIHVWV